MNLIFLMQFLLSERQQNQGEKINQVTGEHQTNMSCQGKDLCLFNRTFSPLFPLCMPTALPKSALDSLRDPITGLGMCARRGGQSHGTSRNPCAGGICHSVLQPSVQFYNKDAITAPEAQYVKTNEICMHATFKVKLSAVLHFENALYGFTEVL